MADAPLHIVFLSAEYPLWASGGVGTFIQTLGRSLVAAGHKVSVVGPGVKSHEEQIEDQGVKLYRLKKNPLPGPNFMYNAWAMNQKLRKLNKQQRIDIIESAELGLALISNSHKAKKVIRLHGGHHFFAEAERRGINWRKGLLEKRSFAKADAFIAGTNYVRAHTGKYLSYHNAAMALIPYPLQTDVALTETSIDPNLILFAGTVCEKKGVRELIQAFSIIAPEFPSLRLELYGRDWFYPDGRSYIETIQKELAEAPFERIHFKGAVSRDILDAHYSQAAVCVFPSHMETQGLVSLEAMLLEKPVIFSQYGPGPETIKHQEDGLLVDVYQPEDIADKIRWVLNHPEQAETLGKRARQAVKERFDLQKVTAQNVAFYRSIQ
ncbi:glycosyltransferase family 4 protein [Gilvibacter sediminis]|uniref:glycosyltransferase family 4 protein n=1 Tax=Gilvibacter sediminis TaxID=379071 RepID=UPI002350701F|nr:glycosyltransferase family 4 protein [Gilvibacter sediminis]MDC7999250.1 glycosyltransferase family 4 protein [Gilvibacter sediminis]